MDIYHQNLLPLAVTHLFAAAEASPPSWVEAVLGIFVIAVGVGSLLFWYKAINRLVNQQELIPYQRSECVLGFVDLVAIFVCWLGSQVAVGVVLVMIAGPKTMSGGEDALFAQHGVLLLYLSAFSGIASLLVGGGYLLFRYRTTNSFGLRLGGLGRQVGYGVVVFTMLFPITLLVQFLLSLLVEYDHPVLSILAESPSFVSIFGCWAAAVLAAPFVEEFLFRGVFQHWLERLSISKFTDDRMLLGGNSLPANADSVANVFDAKPDLPTAELVDPSFVGGSSVDANPANPYESPRYQEIGLADEAQTNQPQANQRKFAYWPIFVSSLCFALVHLGQGLAPIPLFILALGLGYLFRQTGSLVACITVHFLLNFYSMLVFTVMILLGVSP